jgi:hypothetical protein
MLLQRLGKKDNFYTIRKWSKLNNINRLNGIFSLGIVVAKFKKQTIM